MRQSGGKSSTLNIQIPAAIPKSPESTCPDLKQMKNKRASNKLTTHFKNDCIHSVKLLKFWWFPLICQCVILIRTKVLNHSNITESSILNLPGLLEKEIPCVCRTLQREWVIGSQLFLSQAYSWCCQATKQYPSLPYVFGLSDYDLTFHPCPVNKGHKVPLFRSDSGQHTYPDCRLCWSLNFPLLHFSYIWSSWSRHSVPSST